MGRARRLAPGVVALGLALTACGGSSSTAALTTPAPPSAADTTTAGAPTNAALGGTFTRATALPPTVSCTYPPVGTAVKPNTAPPVREISTQDTVPVTVTTGAGDIGLTLDRTVAPCTVNSFVSLAEQTYFDGTRCHRLVTSGIYVLQCGDPTASGTGGPGYVFANEYPTDQYPTGDPRLSQPVNYPRGTIAMANTGKPNSNGSQFFLVYQDSPPPPQYTVFGTIDGPGLAVIEKIAAAGDDGSQGAAGGGAPKNPVTITKVTIAR